MLALDSDLFFLVKVPLNTCAPHFYNASYAYSCFSSSKNINMNLLRGSAIAKIVGANTKRHSMFEAIVQMYTYEEMVNGRKLTEIINNEHENVKYLPGYKLPENIVSI